MKWNWKKGGLIFSIVLSVAIQLVPVDRSNRPVEEGEMPLATYRLMHSEARLSQDQLDTLRDRVHSTPGGETIQNE
jgi:hypothetical protein